jgi:hypothetical protein
VAWTRGALGATALLLLSPAPAAAPPAARTAAFPGTNGRIAFASTRDDNRAQIFLTDPDGSPVTQLTDTKTGANAQPAYSADGLRIAFTSTRDGNREIYSMSADGADEVRLTNNAAQDSEPAWSPDGTQIAFVSTRSGRPQIWRMNADGTGVTRVTTVAASTVSPSWSPDGTRLLFADNRTGVSQIRVLDLATSAVSTALAAGDHPDWSPDGALIAFSRPSQGAWVMNADGSNQRNLITAANANDPAFSPDGSQLAYQAVSGGERRLFTAIAGGARRTRITGGPGVDASPSWGVVPRPAPPVPPAVGESSQVQPVSGSVRVTLPGSTTSVPLTGLGSVPFGSTVDTTRGTVEVTVSAGGGVINSATFNSGVFRLRQKAHENATADAVLSGGSFKDCPKPRKTRAKKSSSKKHSARKLWAEGSGNFKTVGKYASATIRGTRWETIDRCDGTLIRVRSGAVTVRNNAKHRNVVVRAGHSYLARKKR